MRKISGKISLKAGVIVSNIVKWFQLLELYYIIHINVFMLGYIVNSVIYS